MSARSGQAAAIGNEMSEGLVFAIGDLHGRLDLAWAVVDLLAAQSRGGGYRAIFLGDYVDRGPESRGLVEFLMSLARDPRFVFLKGNHEAMMVEALLRRDPAAFARWRAAGGRETLASYHAETFDEALARVPVNHLRWMDALPLTSGDGHRVFVHAGLSPGVPLERQSAASFLWIRDKFLRAPARAFDVHVVHGHTPVWDGKPDPGEPEVLAHRTNLDLAAYATGRVAIGVFDPARAGGPLEILVLERSSNGPIRVERRTPAPVRPSGWSARLGLRG